MTTTERQTTLAEIATRALALEPGGSFMIRVHGGELETAQAAGEIIDAIERHSEQDRSRVSPDEVAMRGIVTTRSGHVLIERIEDEH